MNNSQCGIQVSFLLLRWCQAPSLVLVTSEHSCGPPLNQETGLEITVGAWHGPARVWFWLGSVGEEQQQMIQAWVKTNNAPSLPHVCSRLPSSISGSGAAGSPSAVCCRLDWWVSLMWHWQTWCPPTQHNIRDFFNVSSGQRWNRALILPECPDIWAKRGWSFHQTSCCPTSSYHTHTHAATEALTCQHNEIRQRSLWRCIVLVHSRHHSHPTRPLHPFQSWLTRILLIAHNRGISRRGQWGSKCQSPAPA